MKVILYLLCSIIAYGSAVFGSPENSQAYRGAAIALAVSALIHGILNLVEQES